MKRQAPIMPALAGLVLVSLLALAGCDVNEPARLTSNSRTTSLAYDTSGAPTGTLTIRGSGTELILDLQQLPVLPVAGAETNGWEYEGWLAYEDSTVGATAIPTGRFVVARSNADPLFARGDGQITYGRDGTFQAGGGATATGDARALPDTIAIGPGVTFYLTIEPSPDGAIDSPHPTRILMLSDTLPDSDTTIDLLVPVDFGRSTAGDLSRLVSTISINTVTGEFRLAMTAMGYIDRTEPGGALDAGVIYQAWFVDDDTDPPRYLSVTRFNANLVGDVTIDSVMNPGDSDGDGVPEPLDFERVMVSIEPDAITSQQIVGNGVDTSTDIFENVPYIGILPDVR